MSPSGMPFPGMRVRTLIRARTGSRWPVARLLRRGSSGMGVPCSAAIMVAAFRQHKAPETSPLWGRAGCCCGVPRRLRGRRTGWCRAAAGEGFHIGPVDGQGRGGGPVLGGEAGFPQVSADAGEVIGGGAVGVVFVHRLPPEAVA